MKDEPFTELLASANEALEHAQGKRNLRTTRLPLPPQPLNGRAVKRVRAALRASQAVFARYLNVSTKLVQAWEANRRRPDGPALVLLHIAARQPQVIESVRQSVGSSRARHSRTERQATAD
jgi:putative transcriptional regulator